MAFCRWSSMNWRCDLYCYEDVAGGFTTHVAGNRVVGDIPEEPDLSLLRTASTDWLGKHRAVMEFLATAERTPITLPHAGETFNDYTLAAFKERLLYLRGLGYLFPDDVLSEIDEEIAA